MLNEKTCSPAAAVCVVCTLLYLLYLLPVFGSANTLVENTLHNKSLNIKIIVHLRFFLTIHSKLLSLKMSFFLQIC